MPAPVAGLNPTFPVITDVLPASVILGVPAKIANGAAVPKLTVDCAARATGLMPIIRLMTNIPTAINAPLTILVLLRFLIITLYLLLLVNALSESVHQFQPENV
jgi:hypothetical protein